LEDSTIRSISGLQREHNVETAITYRSKLGFPFNRLGVLKKELEKRIQKRKEKKEKKRTHRIT
jgi:hypothetical protein